MNDASPPSKPTLEPTKYSATKKSSWPSYSLQSSVWTRIRSLGISMNHSTTRLSRFRRSLPGVGHTGKRQGMRGTHILSTPWRDREYSQRNYVWSGSAPTVLFGVSKQGGCSQLPGYQLVIPFPLPPASCAHPPGSQRRQLVALYSLHPINGALKFHCSFCRSG